MLLGYSFVRDKLTHLSDKILANNNYEQLIIIYLRSTEVETCHSFLCYGELLFMAVRGIVKAIVDVQRDNKIE